MSGLLVVSPSRDVVRRRRRKAPGWSSYESELVTFAERLIQACGVPSFELEMLWVDETPVGEYASWRNGTRLGTAAAVELMRRMVRGWSGRMPR